MLSWTILCAISQSTCFAVSYSGSLDRMLDRIKVSDECATYNRKIALIYTSIAWVVFLVKVAFGLYRMFFTGDFLDIMLSPPKTDANFSDLLIPRIVMYLIPVYSIAAWVFPHAMTFMLATIFTRQYRGLSRSFDRMLAESDERRLSDSDIGTLI